MFPRAPTPMPAKRSFQGDENATNGESSSTDNSPAFKKSARFSTPALPSANDGVTTDTIVAAMMTPGQVFHLNDGARMTVMKMAPYEAIVEKIVAEADFVCEAFPGPEQADLRMKLVSQTAVACGLRSVYDMSYRDGDDSTSILRLVPQDGNARHDLVFTVTDSLEEDDAARAAKRHLSPKEFAAQQAKLERFSQGLQPELRNSHYSVVGALQRNGNMFTAGTADDAVEASAHKTAWDVANGYCTEYPFNSRTSTLIALREHVRTREVRPFYHLPLRGLF